MRKKLERFYYGGELMGELTFDQCVALDDRILNAKLRPSRDRVKQMATRMADARKRQES